MITGRPGSSGALAVSRPFSPALVALRPDQYTDIVTPPVVQLVL